MEDAANARISSALLWDLRQSEAGDDDEYTLVKGFVSQLFHQTFHR